MATLDSGGARSWSTMRHTLHQLRRSLSTVSTRAPQSFSFRRLPDGRVRVYFLSARSGVDNQLCFVDLAAASPAGGGRVGSATTTTTTRAACVGGADDGGSCVDDEDDIKLPWQRLFDCALQQQQPPPSPTPTTTTAAAAAPPGGSSTCVTRCSRAEQLLLERKRLVGWGITEYDVHPASGRFVFQAAASVYHVTDTADCRTPMPVPQELASGRQHTRLNPTMCPANPDLIAYVEDGDIWVANSRTGSDDRVTFTRSCSDSVLSAGLPSYVIQEEFARYVGFWWCPVCSDGVYRLLYEVIDESHVELVHLSTQDQGATTESIRYPRAGTANAVSSLRLAEFRLPVRDSRAAAGGTGGEGLVGLCHRLLATPLTALFPWTEYVVRVGWLADGAFISCQLLDRSQCRLEVVALPVALFQCNSGGGGGGGGVSSTGGVPPVQVLLSVQSDMWINVHDVFHVLPSSDSSQFSFLWLDESSGYTHLVKYTTQLIRHAPPNHVAYHASSANRMALTSGEWNVDTKQVWVSHQHGLVFFQANRESAVERHLYVTSYDQPGHVQLLTTPGFYCTAYLDQECSALVIEASNLGTPPVCRAWRLLYTRRPHTSLAGPNGASVPLVSLAPAGLILEPRACQQPPWLPQLHAVTLAPGPDGAAASTTLYCLVYPPVGWVPGRRYPTVLSVYGGPQVQVVTSAFKGYRSLRSHFLAAEGYCVVTIDSRGSHNRGVQFEGHIKNRMGTVEIPDQVEALHALSARLGLIDLGRVAVFGWSYGGYLSLMALTQRPDVFRVAVAGAPVISWNLYDTGYTERYMDLPCRNPCGYETGSVLSYVNQFPSEPGRLLLFHGLCDENVHFLHTQQLIAALVRAGKPYQLQVYPNERHSLRALESSEHFELTLLSFLNSHL